MYAPLGECPDAFQVVSDHVIYLTKLRETASKGYYNRDFDIEIQDVTKSSINANLLVISLGSLYTLQLIIMLESVIKEIEFKIIGKKAIPILPILGLDFQMIGMILAENSDLSHIIPVNRFLFCVGTSSSVYCLTRWSYWTFT